MIKLKDIFLGKTDAKNEVLSNSPEEEKRFLASFVIPPSLMVDKFLSQDKYYITGLKGTGKTALLRYISIKLSENENNHSSFVLFKSEIGEDIRKEFTRAARIQLVDEKSNSSSYDGDDYEAVWRWFIYKKISTLLKGGVVKPFQNNANLSDFISLVGSEKFSERKKNGLIGLFPKLKNGEIEISKSPRLNINFSWDESGVARVKFNELVCLADELFNELDSGGDNLNIFFDELELNYVSRKQHKRDVRLIRDLIVSIERMNAVFKQKGYPICLYAAVRSEVLSETEALGKEINKPIADFGSAILWNRPGHDAKQQPLLHIIEQRINNAIEESGGKRIKSSDIWDNYFPKEIYRQSPQNYILHNSWYRPRDIVRLLLKVQDQYPEEESFTLQSLEAIRKAYSKDSWQELAEGLMAKYKAEEIEGIKNIFYGCKQISSVSELDERVRKKAEEYSDTKKLLQRFGLREILKDLFRMGIVGNIDRKSNKMRFSFRGDDEILFEYEIFVHNALKAHLSIFN
ncbi:P-loop ATPase, Sll1717 family [Vandammella animalimorsus]|uniref:P-loop ATPase, Sll1717 family n=1 Tax=Vandammella animalimorsus TaxID=2029117 RepID=UPI0011774E4B|nr:hypothetical protein [Vandammella animalimorsus]